jgi:hypothetical protein
MIMKNKFLYIVYIIFFFALIKVGYAQFFMQSTHYPPVNWVSDGFNDEIIIHNGNADRLIIVIFVDKIPLSPAISNTSRTLPGINVRNCGRTSHVDAGSSVTCRTSDPLNPVIFHSDTSGGRATGTYLIERFHFAY